MSVRNVPIPVSFDVCGLLGSLSVITTEPVRDPVTVGLKLTLMLQLFPFAREEGQLFVCEKSPVVAMLEIVKACVD